MKKYTEKFLNRKNSGTVCKKNIQHNADKAFEKIKIPKKLWLELSTKKIKLLEYYRVETKSDLVRTIFLAGVVVGWVEKDDLIK